MFGGENDIDVEPEIYVVNAAAGLNMRRGAGVQFEKITTLAHKSKVHVIEKIGKWWMVAEVVRWQR